MPSIIDVALSGLTNHQAALRTTGNNVANVNTPGYSRQQVVFKQAPSQLNGAGFQGTGVSISTIERQTDDFIAAQVRSDTTVLKERKVILNEATKIDNLLANENTGLTPALSSFFSGLQGASDDPTSIPQRQLLLTQSEGMISRFHALNSRLVSQSRAINQNLFSDVSSINSMAKSIAELNKTISIAVGAGQGKSPNDLMDQRDETLRLLSEKVTVNSVLQPDGRANVYIGTGQPLVLGNDAGQLAVVASKDDASRMEIGFSNKGSVQIISNLITGGDLGGALNFRDNVLNPTINSMGRIALSVSDSINKQHQLGMDLEGNLGGNFFKDINETSVARNRVQGNGNNVPPADQVLRVDIKDATKLTTDNYELQIKGPSINDFRLVRQPGGATVQQGVLPTTLPATLDVEGLQITLESGTFNVGDKFLIQPTKTGAQDLNLFIDRVEKIAFASPVRSKSSLGNRGNASISQGEMLNVKNPLTNQAISGFSTPGKLTPPMAVRFISETRYEVLDMTDPSSPKTMVPPLNNQVYNPGLHNELFSTDPGATSVSSVGADTSVIPAPVASPGPFNNGYATQTLTILNRDTTTGVFTTSTVTVGANDSADVIASNLSAVQGVSANAYSQVNLRNFTDNGDATPLGLTINGQALTVTPPAVFGPDELAKAINLDATLQVNGFSASSSGTGLTIKSNKGIDIVVEVTGNGDSITADKVSPYTGSVLSSQTITSGNGVSIGGFIDLNLANGVSMTADVDSVFQQAPPAQTAYLGFKMDIIGDAKAGDMFTIGYNTGGYSDNRNALALASLETKGIVSNGISTYAEAYSQLVETIGTTTNQARLDTDASTTLLKQSEENKATISGVNLDEEAARLIQFQAAYNASAQLVSVSRELFDRLLNTFR